MKLLLPLLFLLASSQMLTAQNLRMSQKSFSGSYTISTVFGEDLSSHKMTLKVDTKTGNIKGNTGCNEYLTGYNTLKNKLKFSLIAITKMKCDHKAQEDTYLEALRETTSYTLENNILTLYNKDEELVTATSRKKS